MNFAVQPSHLKLESLKNECNLRSFAISNLRKLLHVYEMLGLGLPHSSE